MSSSSFMANGMFFITTAVRYGSTDGTPCKAWAGLFSEITKIR